MNWTELMGQTIVGMKGIPSERWGKPHTPLSIILFDDCETIMEFEEQDPYDFHDCSPSARIINLYKDAAKWRQIANEDGYEEATDLSCPF